MCGSVSLLEGNGGGSMFSFHLSVLGTKLKIPGSATGAFTTEPQIFLKKTRQVTFSFVCTHLWGWWSSVWRAMSLGVCRTSSTGSHLTKENYLRLLVPIRVLLFTHLLPSITSFLLLSLLIPSLELVPTLVLAYHNDLLSVIRGIDIRSVWVCICKYTTICSLQLQFWSKVSVPYLI